VAITERYHGQFVFYGRLREPLQEIEPAQVSEWSRSHPDGYLVMSGKEGGTDLPGVLFRQPYQSGYLAIVEAAPGAVAGPEPVTPAP